MNPEVDICENKIKYIFLPIDRPAPAGGGPETPYLIRMALKSMKNLVRGSGCLEHRFNPAMAPGKD